MKKRCLRLAMIVLTALAALAIARPLSAMAATGPRCYVDVDAALGANSGNDWANAYVDLQTALADAACIETWVAEGRYVPGADASLSFNIVNGKKLYGGFAATETLREQRDPWTNLTILSGDIGKDDLSEVAATPADIQNTNSTTVVYMQAITSSTVLDGFVITAGSGVWGAGLFCNGDSSVCNPTLANLVFSGNLAIQGGGGMYNNANNGGVGSPRLTNVTFTGNVATIDGGGAMRNSATLGGISSPVLTNVTFTGNQSVRGGALLNDGRGGTSSPVLKNVTFEANTASEKGGAIFNLSGWSLESAGTSSPVLTNVTFHGNTATNDGGAVYNAGSYGTLKPRLTNVILWGNSALVGAQMHNESAAAPTIRYSAVELGDVGIGGSSGLTAFSDGAGNTDQDPKLTTFGDYAGPTRTLLPMAGSSAINAGLATACPAKDQRGVPRPQGPRCDIGATEARYKTFKSSAAQDGWALESGEDGGVGGTKNGGSTTLRVGDDALDQQYRSILSFNTGTLPIGAQPISILAKVRHAGIVGTDPFSTVLGHLGAHCSNGGFGGNPALEVSDFQAAGTVPGFGLAFGDVPIGGWYTAALFDSHLGCLSENGVTQFRLLFYGADDNDNGVADYLKLYSGNALASQRPQLIITYFIDD